MTRTLKLHRESLLRLQPGQAETVEGARRGGPATVTLLGCSQGCFTFNEGPACISDGELKCFPTGLRKG